MVMKKIETIFLFAFLLGWTHAQTSHAQVDLRMGGYMQAWYVPVDHIDVDGETSDTYGFRLRRSRMMGTARLNDTFSATIWYEFANPTRNMIDFFFDAKISPAWNIRVGQFIPAGQTFDTGRLVSSMLIFDERPVMTRALSNNMGYEFFRDIGVMAWGQQGIFWYAIHAGNGTGRFVQTGSNITNRSFGSGLYGVRLDVTPVQGLTIGSHLAWNYQKDFQLQNQGVPYDINNRSFSVRVATDALGIPEIFTQAEYAIGARDDTQTFDYSGWYAQIGYRITPATHALVRLDKYSEEFSGSTQVDNTNITLGMLHLFFHENREIAKFGLNYRRGTFGPGDVTAYSVTAWFQVRFIPVR